MRSRVVLLALASASLCIHAAAQTTAVQAQDEIAALRARVHELEAMGAAQGVSVFSFPLAGLISAASSPYSTDFLGEDAIAAAKTVIGACQNDISTLCAATAPDALGAPIPSAFHINMDNMRCLADNFPRVSEPCVDAAHAAQNFIDLNRDTTFLAMKKVAVRGAYEGFKSSCSSEVAARCSAGAVMTDPTAALVAGALPPRHLQDSPKLRGPSADAYTKPNNVDFGPPPPMPHGDPMPEDMPYPKDAAAFPQRVPRDAPPRPGRVRLLRDQHDPRPDQRGPRPDHNEDSGDERGPSRKDIKAVQQLSSDLGMCMDALTKSSVSDSCAVSMDVLAHVATMVVRGPKGSDRSLFRPDGPEGKDNRGRRPSDDDDDSDSEDEGYDRRPDGHHRRHHKDGGAFVGIVLIVAVVVLALNACRRRRQVRALQARIQQLEQQQPRTAVVGMPMVQQATTRHFTASEANNEDAGLLQPSAPMFVSGQGGYPAQVVVGRAF